MNRRILVSVVMSGLLFSGMAMPGFAKTLETPSTMTEVTVYPGSAHVTREAALELSEGEHSIVLNGIIPEIDENSLAVAGQGKARVKIFGGYIKKAFLTQVSNQRVQELLDKIEALDDQGVAAHSQMEILNKEREFLNSLNLFAGQQIPKELVTKMPSTEDLGGVLNFLASNLGDIEKKREEIRQQLRALNREKERLNRQLADLRNTGSQTERSIIVDLECLTAGKFTLRVSYLVRGANWRPIYDARARCDKGEVELTSYGMVKQSTGEDWSDVQLTLSTAKPTLGGRMPYVAPWVLQPYRPVEQRRKRTGLREVMKSAAAPALQYEAFDAAAVDEEGGFGGVMQEAEMNYADVSSSGIAVEYKIVRPSTVKSDGSEYRFPVATQTLKADFEYSTYPRSRPFAYLGSRVENSEDLQLLAGQVNLFLEGDYVGKSSIDNIGPGEEFDFYLGVDESVKVERRQVSRKVDDVLMAGIPSPNRTTTFRYQLKVENYKDKKIRVVLFESMPVSANERIKVRIFDVSSPPAKKDWKDRQGVWRWEFDLDPKGEKEIDYSFSVEHPRDMTVPGI